MKNCSRISLFAAVFALLAICSPRVDAQVVFSMPGGNSFTSVQTRGGLFGGRTNVVSVNNNGGGSNINVANIGGRFAGFGLGGGRNNVVSVNNGFGGNSVNVANFGRFGGRSNVLSVNNGFNSFNGAAFVAPSFAVNQAFINPANPIAVASFPTASFSFGAFNTVPFAVSGFTPFNVGCHASGGSNFTSFSSNRRGRVNFRSFGF